MPSYLVNVLRCAVRKSRPKIDVKQINMKEIELRLNIFFANATLQLCSATSKMWKEMNN